MEPYQTSRLWMVNAGFLIERESNGTTFDRCYYRGKRPQVAALGSIHCIDVNILLASNSLKEIVQQILQDLSKGQAVIYASTIPLQLDQIAASLRSQVTTEQMVEERGNETLPALPAEMTEDTCTGLVLIEGLSLREKYYPPFSPAQAVVIYDPQSAGDQDALKRALLHVYPGNHPVFTGPSLDLSGGWKQSSVEDMDLADADLLLIPPRSVDSSLENFAEVIAHLRAPNGCPWDRKQTHDSLRTYLLEETYEALSALDEKDMSGLKEELGDLILQILLHAEIGVEKGEFNLSDILEGINRKIIYRHPHVFGEVQVSGVKDVVQNWEKLKEKEREENGKEEIKGILDGVPPTFPALAQAQAIQDRAARVGFDWPEIAPVKAKIMEEMDEVYTAPDEAHRAKELGDLLFAVVNLVRWYKVDAESALRETNLKFRRRFGYIEQKSRENSKAMLEMTLEEMDAFWEEAKKFDR